MKTNITYIEKPEIVERDLTLHEIPLNKFFIAIPEFYTTRGLFFKAWCGEGVSNFVYSVSNLGNIWREPDTLFYDVRYVEPEITVNLD